MYANLRAQGGRTDKSPSKGTIVCGCVRKDRVLGSGPVPTNIWLHDGSQDVKGPYLDSACNSLLYEQPLEPLSLVFVAI